MIKLRSYQETSINSVRQSYANGSKAPLLVLPTGAGKTICFSYIASSAVAKGNKVWILVHRVELLRQTSEKLTWAGVRHGLINPLYTADLSAKCQVASVQTLVKRIDRYKQHIKPDLIIIDEAHHATASTYRQIIDAYPHARVLGVTATPIRSDGKGLGALSGGLFDDMIVGPQISELIQLGFLVKPVVYAPTERLDLSGIKVKLGDYDKKEIELRVDKPTITGNAVAHYTKLCAGSPAVAFCISVAHAEHVANEFRMAGYRAYAVDGSMDDDQRKRILGGLANGSVQVVCSCDLISEGTDIPAIGCAILLRPTQSTSLFIQQVGRALRTCEGKEHAIILDHVGNVLTHGMPEDDRDWSLDGEVKRGGKKKKKEQVVRVKQCPSCYAMHNPAPNCPHCEYKYEVEAREIKQEEGELRQVTEDAAKIIRKQRSREVGAARTLEDLLRVQKARGYKEGWANHVWMSRNKKEFGI